MPRADEIVEIERDLEKALREAGVSDLVDIPMIRRWMTDVDEKGELFHLTMIMGLLDIDFADDTRLLNRLIDALHRFHAHLPSRMLDGNTPGERFRRDRAEGKPVKVRIERMRIPPDDWAGAYNEANAALSGKDFLTARDGFDEAFELLLRDRTTGREIYRLFGNAGTAYMLTGDPSLGRACWNAALELNPKYTYAREQIDQFESGGLDNFAVAGLLGMASKNLERRLSKEHLNREKVLRWPENKILRRLSGYNVKVNRQGFIDAARKRFSPDAVAEELLFPGSTATGMDEDFILFAAEALWKLYCPDEPSVNTLDEILEEARRYMDEKSPDDEGGGIEAEYLKRLAVIEKYLLSGKPGFLAYWVGTFEYHLRSRYDLVHVLIGFSERTGLEADVASFVGKLRENLAEPYLDLVDISILLRRKDRCWNELYSGLRKKLPDDAFVPVTVSDVFERMGDIGAAEAHLLEALDLVDAVNARPDKPAETAGRLRNDYEIVLTRLETLYAEHAPEVNDIDAKRALAAQKRERIKALPEVAPPLDKAMEEAISSIEEEEVRRSPAMRYYEFLKRFGIDFETDEAPPVKKKLFSVGKEDFDFRRGKEGLFDRVAQKGHSDMASNREREVPGKAPARAKKANVARNAPCPCGSGKKYKRCCGKD